MSENKKIKFLKLYNKLPESIQNFLASDKIGVIINDALNLSKVPSEKIFSIMDLITEVLFLQLPKEQFRNELEKKIEVSPVAAQIIDKVIETKIFKTFEEELSQYKHQPLKEDSSQEKEMKKIEKPMKPLEELIRPLEIPKTKPLVEKQAKQLITKQTPSEQIIPEYSFPEPPKIKVEKPINKTGELKKIIAPKVSSNQQEKIREKLLAAMQKKNGQPKIVEEIKKVLLKPLPLKKTKEEKTPRKIKTGKLTSSKILSGEGKKFKDEESFIKTGKERPYILNAKLKEGPTLAKYKQKKEKISREEPIPYKKYEKKNPFGKA